METVSPKQIGEGVIANVAHISVALGGGHERSSKATIGKTRLDGRLLSKTHQLEDEWA